MKNSLLKLALSQQPKLYKMAIRMFQNSERAEDAVQTFLLKVLKSEAEAGNAPLNHLFTSFKNTCLTQMQKERSFSKMLEQAPRPEPTYTQMHKLELSQILASKQKTKKLPPMRQRTLELALKGYDFAEMAKELNVPYDTAKSNYRWLWQDLSKHMQEVA